VILLLSGTTVTWAHHALLHGDRKGLIWGLTLTIALGILFSGVQAYEYSPCAVRLLGFATSTAPPSTWRPASTASTFWSARSS
jgi:heme/copper-type cytochrome/quinol oxidase subunit 3